MKLTHRQRDILGEIESLQNENQGDPIHYSMLAQKMDIGNSTAYHMLRVLEGKGCIVSRYRLPEVRIGRSSVVFEMTDAGREATPEKQ